MLYASVMAARMGGTPAVKIHQQNELFDLLQASVQACQNCTWMYGRWMWAFAKETTALINY
jgi:hypothetical protein